MTSTVLRADCAQCAALCCVALAFDRSEMFAVDKAAGEACSNLSPRDRCLIHADRAKQGFGGCVQYDCLGAGQRVTQMFAGESWRDGEETAREVFDAFRSMRRVHELVALFRSARLLALSWERERAVSKLLEQLEGDWTPASLCAFGRSDVEREVRAVLASLRDCFPA
jgi:hypothetical protein